MATLNEQIGLMDTQLKLNQQAGNARHILGEYETIHGQLSQVDEPLKTVYERSLVLQKLPEDAPQKMNFSEEVRAIAKSALSVLQTFTDRWNSERHEARQGNDLARATASLKSLIGLCSTQVNQCWQSWATSLETLVGLEDFLLESQKNIPGMEITYDAFVRNRNQFRELVGKFPEDADDIKDLQRISTLMQQLKDKMQFDLPVEVATFFKHLDSINRRVSLATMTPEVFEWLRSHNLLDSYVVSRKVTIRGY